MMNWVICIFLLLSLMVGAGCGSASNSGRFVAKPTVSQGGGANSSPLVGTWVAGRADYRLVIGKKLDWLGYEYFGSFVRSTKSVRTYHCRLRYFADSILVSEVDEITIRASVKRIDVIPDFRNSKRCGELATSELSRFKIGQKNFNLQLRVSDGGLTAGKTKYSQLRRVQRDGGEKCQNIAGTFASVNDIARGRVFELSQDGCEAVTFRRLEVGRSSLNSQDPDVTLVRIVSLGRKGLKVVDQKTDALTGRLFEKATLFSLDEFGDLRTSVVETINGKTKKRHEEPIRYRQLSVN